MYQISIINDTTARIKVHGSNFYDDLERLKKEIPSTNREYDPEEKFFTIKNISDVEFSPLKVAISEHKLQLPLF